MVALHRHRFEVSDDREELVLQRLLVVDHRVEILLSIPKFPCKVPEYC